MAPAGAAAANATAASTSNRTQPTSATGKPGSSRTGSTKTPTTRSGRSSRSTRSTRSGSIRSGRTGSRGLAARPTARPPLPPLDPLNALVPGVVPERKRYCSSCDAQLKRDNGFCPKCGQEYSFIPTLTAGDLVLDKYEIKGTVAFGGLGWIYLALDTVLSRWVTMKGLLNAKDPKMIEVAVAEREFLAAVKHPNIVSIYDFITHGEQGFIVMEYVNGKTLMALRKERGGPLPPGEAISYILEMLPAFDYLDQNGLVYCDMKPENVMVEEDTVKLIDLGAVRRADDTGGDIYGSKGYTAPEAHEAPSPLSDLYSIGRALAVLVATFDFQGKYETSLPPPEEVEVFRQHEPLYRFLQKATRKNPDERFQTASEMAEQLVGVLRSVVGQSADLGPIESTLFAPDSDRELESPSTRSSRKSDGVPKLRVDPSDAAASVIIAAGAVPDPERRLAMFERAMKQFTTSVELKLRIVDELVTLGRFEQAEHALAEIQKDPEHAHDWRLAWYRGRSLLAQGKVQETVAAFDALASELPGELAPRQALGVAHEQAGDLDRAVALYEAIGKTDASYASATMRLARCYERRGEKDLALAAYKRVPSGSARFSAAQLGLARCAITSTLKTPVSLNEVLAASEALESLDASIDNVEVHVLRGDVLIAGVDCLKGGAPTKTKILGCPLEAEALRAAAEKELRLAGRQAKTELERCKLVDRANEMRPITWV
jgi:serine/threonine-protein kinase PknG